jgi:hypothetical protein
MLLWCLQPAWLRMFPWDTSVHVYASELVPATALLAAHLQEFDRMYK